MCEKCQNTGHYVTKPFIGAWKVNPCSCQTIDDQAFKERINGILEKWNQYAASKQ